MNNTSALVSSGTTIVTAIAAILSLFLTVHQTKISNKQHLFDRKLHSWKVCHGLYKQYEEAEMSDFLTSSYSHDLGEVVFSPYFEFELCDLTDDLFFGKVGKLFSSQNDKSQKEAEELLWLKCDELQDLSIEMPLIFHGECERTFSDFVEEYQKLLREIYDCSKNLDKSRNLYINGISLSPKERRMEAINYPGNEEVRKTIQKMEKLKSTIRDNHLIDEMKKQVKL